MKHYTQKEAKKLLKENNIKWEDFAKWMTGQTGPMVDGEFCYYRWDVDRFISYQGKAENEPLAHWD